MHLGRPGANAISNGQASAPIFGRNRPLEGRQQRRRIGIGNRKHRNFRDGFSFFHREPLGISGRADSWGQWIAGIIGIHYAATLYPELGTPAAIWIIVAVVVAVAFGIGINNAADGSMFAGNFGLDSA